MRSLKSRLLAYHLLTALALAAIASTMAVFVLVQILGQSLNQTLAGAARGLPDMVGYYVARDGSLERAAPSIVAHLASEGVVAVVIPHNRFPTAQPFLRPPRFPPPLFSPGLVLAGAHPIRVSVKGGELILGINPQRVAWANEYIPALVACIFLAIVGTGLVVGSSTARRALEPLARTTAALTRLGNSDFHVESVRTNDPSELGELARAYNRAVEAVRKAFAERARTESEMQQFVADAGHQLRTPLTVIMGHLSALSLCASDTRTEAAIDNMLTESRRMRDLIEDLIVLARLEESDESPEPVDLRALLLEFVRTPPFKGNQSIRLGTLHEGIVEARFSDIRSALTALMDNAEKYAPNSPLEIDLYRIDSSLRLRVMDRGPGMSEADLDRAFDRFYRGGAGANVPGSGLGLAIIRRIVERSGGSIDLHNRTGGGLECVLSFPASDARPEAGALATGVPHLVQPA